MRPDPSSTADRSQRFRTSEVADNRNDEIAALEILDDGESFLGSAAKSGHPCVFIRTLKMACRFAVNVAAGRIVRLVMRQSLGVTAGGMAIGLASALVAAPRIGSLLIGVGTRDPFVMGLVSVTLLFAAAAASFGPAWRAARVDPVEALRAS